MKELNFHVFLPTKELLFWRKTPFSALLPAHPDLGGGFRGFTTASVPASFSPPVVHHALFHEGIRRSCCFGWIKLQTFSLKQAEVMGRRKRGLFQKEVCLVDLNGGVKLYRNEMLLLLFMNYPVLCLTLPEISFYWHVQSSAIIWLLSTL